MTIHRLDTDSIELTLWRMTTADDEVRCVVDDLRERLALLHG